MTVDTSCLFPFGFMLHVVVELYAAKGVPGGIEVFL